MNARKLSLTLALLAIFAGSLSAAPTGVTSYWEGDVTVIGKMSATGTYAIRIETDGLYGWSAGTELTTFCLEAGNHDFGEISQFKTYRAVLNTGAVYGGYVWDGGVIGGTRIQSPGSDPLHSYTAYLYDAYRANPGAYDYNALQTAIWYIEAELGANNPTPSQITGLAYDYWQEAITANWTDIGSYRVLNMYLWQNGEWVAYQDFIIPPVPAPGAVLLAGVGTAVVGWLRRRKVV